MSAIHASKAPATPVSTWGETVTLGGASEHWWHHGGTAGPSAAQALLCTAQNPNPNTNPNPHPNPNANPNPDSNPNPSPNPNPKGSRLSFTRVPHQRSRRWWRGRDTRRPSRRAPGWVGARAGGLAQREWCMDGSSDRMPGKYLGRTYLLTYLHTYLLTYLLTGRPYTLRVCIWGVY
jgi:hypothetical protein